MYGLKKELSLLDLIFIGIGCIVGAGVFIIMGKTIKIGGKFILISFLLVGFLSMIMGLIYVEMYSRYESEITEYLSVKNAMGENMGKIHLSFVYFYAIFTSITVIVGLTKYLGFFKGNYFKEIGFSISILIGIMMINLSGIKTSKIVSNTVGISLLSIFLGIILIGFNKINIGKIINGPKVNWNSFIFATILAFYLFNGYDVLIKMSAEAKDEKDTKKAVIWSVGLTSFFYIMIIIILISVMGYSQITNHPISEIYEYLVNKKISQIVFLIGAVILFNTAFLKLLGASRFLYGLGNNDIIPFNNFLTKVNINQAPQNSILVTFVIAVLCCLLNNEIILAVITNFSVIYMLISISTAMLITRWKERDDEKERKHNYIKGNINNIPIPVVISLGILIFFFVTIIKNKFWIGKTISN